MADQLGWIDKGGTNRQIRVIPIKVDGVDGFVECAAWGTVDGGVFTPFGIGHPVPTVPA